MKRSTFFRAAGAAVVFGIFSTSAVNASTLGLGLVIDGSGSISSADFDLQTDAYASIFGDSDFFADFVEPSDFDALEVSVVQFGDSIFGFGPAIVEVDRFAIGDQQDAEAFATLFDFNQIGGNTPTADAIDVTAGLLLEPASDDVTRTVIDISTDGGANTGIDPVIAANSARAAGIDEINAIGVGVGIDLLELEGIAGVGLGTDQEGFVLTPNDFGDFESTLTVKLEQEIVGDVELPGDSDSDDGEAIPEPTTILGTLLATAIGGRFVKRRQAAAA